MERPAPGHFLLVAGSLVARVCHFTELGQRPSELVEHRQIVLGAHGYPVLLIQEPRVGIRAWGALTGGLLLVHFLLVSKIGVLVHVRQALDMQRCLGCRILGGFRLLSRLESRLGFSQILGSRDTKILGALEVCGVVYELVLSFSGQLFLKILCLSFVLTRPAVQAAPGLRLQLRAGVWHL